MKNAIVNVKLFLMALGAVLVLSCSSEDGEDGAMGAQGEQGIAGLDGTDGTDGVDGTDGTDGADGNANVTSFTFDISSVAGSFHDQAIPELTQSVIDNDVILGYVKRETRWYPLPSVADNLPFSIAVYISPAFYSLDFVDRVDGSAYTSTAGYLDTLKVVIIEANESTTSKAGHPDFTKMTYQEVMDYLKLEH